MGSMCPLCPPCCRCPLYTLSHLCLPVRRVIHYALVIQCLEPHHQLWVTEANSYPACSGPLHVDIQEAGVEGVGNHGYVHIAACAWATRWYSKRVVWKGLVSILENFKHDLKQNVPKLNFNSYLVSIRTAYGEWLSRWIHRRCGGWLHKWY